MRSEKFRIAVREFGPFESALVKQWDAFERNAHTGLEFEPIAMDLHTLFESTFSNGGLRRGEWDAALVNTDWIAAAQEQRTLLDLAKLIRWTPPDDYPNGWAPSLLRMQEYGGQVFGLPYHDGPECLIYRTDLFDDPSEQQRYLATFGKPLRVPQTWEEFESAARFFHRPDVPLYGAIFAAYPDGHNTVYDFCLQVWTRGGELVDRGGRIRLDSLEAIEGLRFLRAILNNKAAVHPACRSMDSVKSGLAFAAGEAALMVNWFGFAAMAQTIASSKIKGRVSVAPVPHSPGHASASLNIYWILSIAAGAVHKSIAWDFLRHCASADMDKLLTLEGAIGCRKSTWSDPQVNQVIPFYQRMADLHVDAREMPRLSQWPRIAQAVDRMVIAAIDTAEDIGAIVKRGQAEIEDYENAAAGE